MQSFSVGDICDDGNSWKVFLNYLTNQVEVTLVSGGAVANETVKGTVVSLNYYGPFWKLTTNGLMMTKYVGCKLFRG